MVCLWGVGDIKIGMFVKGVVVVVNILVSVMFVFGLGLFLEFGW